MRPRSLATALLGALLSCLAALPWSAPAEAGGLRDMNRAHAGKDKGTLDLLVYFEPSVMQGALTPNRKTGYEDVLKSYSNLLYNATEGQLRIRRFRLSTYMSDLADADIIVERGTAGARASLNGLQHRSEALTISQLHRSLTSKVRGDFGLLHESGHYLFGLGDEYRGIVTVTLADGSEQEILVCDNQAINCGTCNGDMGSVMDGGTKVNNGRREFCLHSDGPTACGADLLLTDVSHQGPERKTSGFWSAPDASCTDEDLIRVTSQSGVFASDQQREHAASCWETIARIRFNDLGVPVAAPTPDGRQSPIRLAYPASGVGPNGDPPDEPTFVYTQGDLAMLVLVDTSSSVGQNVQQARQLARELVLLMEDTENIGVAYFDFDLSRGPGDEIQPLPIRPKAGLSTAADVDAIFANAPVGATGRGWTNLGGSIAEAVEILRGSPTDPDAWGRYAGRNVVVLTDGRHTLGRRPADLVSYAPPAGDNLLDPPAATKFPLVMNGELVHVIGLGADDLDPDLVGLQNKTIGAPLSWNADSCLSIGTIAPWLLATARGGAPVFAHVDCQPPLPALASRSEDVSVAAGARAFDVTLMREPDAPLALAVRSARTGLTYESDNPLHAAFFTITQHHIVFRATGADFVVGDWTFTVRNVSDTESSGGYQVLSTAALPSLSASATLVGESPVRFPGPVHLEMSLRDRGAGVVGATVEAEVHHLGVPGVVETVPLFDDGGREHGDERAGDGIYSALYFGYAGAPAGGGDGRYRFLVTAVNVDGVRSGAGEDGGESLSGTPVAPFRLQDVVEVEVVGTPTVMSPGSIRIRPPAVANDTILPASALSVTPVLRFGLDVSGEEAVRVDTLTISSSGSGREDLVDEVALYFDPVGAGPVHNPHDWIARGRFDADDGQLTFRNANPGAPLVVLEPGVTNFVVTFGRLVPAPRVYAKPQAGPPAPKPGSAPPLPLLGLLVVVLGIAVACGKKRVATVAVSGACFALAFLVTGAIGCGGGGLKPPEPPSLAGLYDVVVEPQDVRAEGIVTGTPFTAEDPQAAQLPVTGTLELR